MNFAAPTNIYLIREKSDRNFRGGDLSHSSKESVTFPPPFFSRCEVSISIQIVSHLVHSYIQFSILSKNVFMIMSKKLSAPLQVSRYV